MIAALVLTLECRGGLLLRSSQEPLSRLRDLKSSRDEQWMETFVILLKRAVGQVLGVLSSTLVQ